MQSDLPHRNKERRTFSVKRYDRLIYQAIDAKELKSLVDQGAIVADDLITHNGGKWQPASSIKGLSFPDVELEDLTLSSPASCERSRTDDAILEQ